MNRRQVIYSTTRERVDRIYSNRMADIEVAARCQKKNRFALIKRAAGCSIQFVQSPTVTAITDSEGELPPDGLI